MERETFEAMIESDGYKAVHRKLEPGLAVDKHDHAWDTKGLVLQGQFTIVCAGDSRTYAAGQVFELAAGIAHTQSAGTDGAELLVGRQAANG